MPFAPPPQPAALRGGRSRVQLGPPGRLRGAEPEPDHDLQRKGGVAAGPRAADDRAAERGRHGAGLHRDAALPRGGTGHGRPSVRGAGDGGGAGCDQRSGLRRPADREPAGCADPHSVGRAGSGAVRHGRAVRHPGARTACWPISAAARWNWCGWSPASAGPRGRCRSASSGSPSAPAAIRWRRGPSPRKRNATVPWLPEAAGRDLYLVGGAWRALARIHMAQTGYPLAMVHHYTIGREEARDLAGVVAGAGRRALERLPGMSRRRIDDLPYAAVVLRRLLRATGGAPRGVQRQRPARRLVHAAPAAGDRVRSAARRGVGAGGAARAAIPPCRRR